MKSFLNNKFLNNDTSKDNFNEKHISYHKLPYISDISVSTKKMIGDLCKRFCKNTYRFPDVPKSLAVYKFTCAGFQSRYIGKTRCHLAIRMNEHLVTDKKSHKLKHLFENPTVKSLSNESCSEVIDSTTSTFRLKVKEALHINWLQQTEHVSIIISV